MPQIELEEQLFLSLQRRAQADGYATVDKYVADVLQSEVDETGEENFDHIFTPECIADLERIAADIRTGAKTFTLEEVREHLDGLHASWLESNAK